MVSVEIPEKKIKIEFPESLKECNQKQYIDISYFLYQLNSRQIDFNEFKLLSIYKLLGLSYTKKSRLSEEEKEKMYANISLLSDYVENFFHKDDKGNIQSVKFDFIHNPVPKVDYEGTTLYGPTDVFQNITFGEYKEGLEYFQKYINPMEEEHRDLDLLLKEKEAMFKRDIEYPNFEKQLEEIEQRIEEIKRYIFLENQKKSRYLRELFAVFYRTKRRKAKFIGNKEYDIRKPFNKYQVFKQSEKLVRMDMGILYGFFLYFYSFQSYLDQAQLRIGGKDIDLSILFEKDNTQQKEAVPGLGMLSVGFNLSQSQVFGDLEKVDQTNFWKVILYLYDVKKKYLDEKANTPQTPK